MMASQMLQTTGPNAIRRREPVAVATSSITTRDLLTNLFYYGRIILLIVLGVVLLGVAAAFLLPPRYVAEAKVLTLNASYYDIRARQPDQPTQSLDPTEVVNVEMQLLSSEDLHRRVVQLQLGPAANREDIDTALASFERKIHIEKVEGANVIALTFTDRNAQAAADTLKRLLQVYFEQRGNLLTSGRLGFLTAQRDKAKAQLDAANTQILAYQDRYNVVDVPSQTSAAVSLDGALREQRMLAESTIAEANGSLARLRSQAATTPKTIELFTDDSQAATALGAMQSTLLQLQAKRAELASRYMAGSPLITQADQQIVKLRAEIAQARPELMVSRHVGLNAAYQNVQDRMLQAGSTAASAVARRAILDKQLAASGQRLKSLIDVSDTLARLRQQRDMLGDNYRRFASQVEQARIQQNEATSAAGTNVRVIQPPVAPHSPSNPPAMFIAAALLIALVLAAAVVFLLTTLRETFLTPQEAERKLRLPVLSAPIDDGFTGVSSGHDYGRMIAAIEHSSTLPTKVVLLVSAYGDDGLDTLAEGLFQALGRRAPERVAAIDADSARAELGPGWIARSGDQLLAELRRVYSYVLLIAPPTTVSSEAVEMATRADVVIALIRAESTRNSVAQEMIGRIADTGAPVTGLAMSGRRTHIPAFIYNRI